MPEGVGQLAAGTVVVGLRGPGASGALRLISTVVWIIPAHCWFAARAILRNVEILFTTLLILALVAVTWFAMYVVYRLYSNQR